MKAEKSFINAVRAGYSLFYARTFELDRSIETLENEVNKFNDKIEKTEVGKRLLKMFQWSFINDEGQPTDPDNVIDLLEKDTDGYYDVIFAKNWNWFCIDDMKEFDKQKTTFIQNNVKSFSSSSKRKVLVILSDQSFEKAIPAPIQKDFMNLEFGLPTEEEIEKVLDSIIETAKLSEKFVQPTEEERVNIIDSSKGLTERELYNAFSYSLIQDEGRILSSTIADIQARDIEKTAGLKIGKYPTIGELIGYERMKKFVLKSIKSKNAKGILVLGPAGTGKSHFAKYIANVTNKKCIELEMAQLFGKYVGDSEGLMREAINIITANAPCILFIDEIEKGLAGVGGGTSGGSEVTKRSMSQFLKFLSDDRPEGVYVIATCNNISSLPPEWVRAERWDCAPFFVDLPKEETRNSILDYYKKNYNVKGKIKSTEGWSGAELKAVCRVAEMMEVKIDDAEEFVIPVSKTMAEEIEALRKWSKNRTINAETFEAKTNDRAIVI